MTKFAFSLLLILSIFISSCQSTVDLHVDANKNLNPDFQRKTQQPVSIQVYQMKDPKKFNEANFFQITDEPEKTMGPDLLAPMNNFMIIPNQKQNISVKLNSDAKFLGIIAAFESIDNSKWRAVVPLEGKHKSDISIQLKDKILTVN